MGGLSKNLHHCWLFAPASAVEVIKLVCCVCVCTCVCLLVSALTVEPFDM